MHLALVIAAHLALVAIGVWLAVIDAREHRLPNRIVLPTLVASLSLVGVEALVLASGERAVRALLGMLILGGFYLLLGIGSRGGIGGGDVKLAALLGVVLGWHGWQALALGTIVAFVLASLYAIVLMSSRRATSKTRIAFGPWMLLGASLAIALNGGIG